MTASSKVMAEDPAVDLAILQAMAEELETYLVQDELYRTLQVNTPSGTQSIKMTGGDMLARLNRVQSVKTSLTTAQQSALDTLTTQIQGGIRSLRTRFHERLAREVESRLNSLIWFMDDCAEDRKRCRVEYPYEIRNRQRIEEILKEVGDGLDEQTAAKLKQVDQRLRGMTKTTPFIWDDALEASFPRQPYWYLYALP